MLFVICTLVLLVVSRLRSENDEAYRYLTYAGVREGGFKTTVAKSDVILTAILIAAVIILWITFSPFGIV